MARRRMDVEALEERLGHAFKDRELLARALTHVSAAGGSYQRLEFLGDRVLGLAVAELLYAAYPEASEGELSQRFSELVRRETCAEVAAEWDAGAFIRLGPGEAQTGGRRKMPILADVCESILGAVFLDGGYEAARSLVERSFAGRMRAPVKPVRDPKTVLQEWAQGRGLPVPVYALAERTGPDHSPVFVIAARVQGLEDGLGSGRSKRVAEQEAARTLLVREGVWKDEADERSHGEA